MVPAIALSLLLCLPALATPVPLLPIEPVTRTDRDSLTTTYLKARDVVEQVRPRLRDAQRRFIDAPLEAASWDFALAELALANTELLLASNRLDWAAKDLQLATQRLRSAQLHMMPSRSVEARGLYLDAGSIPKTKQGVTELLERLSKAGFNQILPELFRRGYTLYPSRFTEQDPEFRAAEPDLMAHLFQEAHRLNLEVHPWIWTFRVRSPGFGNPVLDKLPALAAVPSPEKFADARFLSPASPEARQFVLKLVKEIRDTFPIDGILLDYIRYDETVPEDTVSQTLFRLEQIDKTGRYPPNKIIPGDPLFVEWQLWREEKVTRMVQDINLALGKPIGVAVFRGESYSRMQKMQNWRHWANNGWVSYINPMLYTNNLQDLHTWFDWETDKGKRHDLLYPVLGAHRFDYPEDLFAQIGTIRDHHLPGLGIFALAHFKLSLLDDLAKGPFRTPAVTPHRDLPDALRRSLLATSEWLMSLKLPAYPEIVGIAQQLAQTAESVPIAPTSANLQALSSQLNQVADSVQALRRMERLPGDLDKEVADHLGDPQALIQIYLAMQQARQGYTAPTTPNIRVDTTSKTLPRLEVPYLNGNPPIDGRLEDFWQAAATTIDPFFQHTGAGRAEAHTLVKLGYDRQQLYIAVVADEPNMDKIKASPHNRDSQDIFSGEDAVEIFLRPQPQGPIYHLVINAAGSIYDARDKDASWNGQWQAAVKKGPGYWTVEMSVPFSTLGQDAMAGSQWRANFARNRYHDKSPYSAWSAPFGDYYTPERFGHLQFE